MNSVSRMLFELYEPAAAVPVDDFGALACRWLKLKLPFDSCAVGTMFYRPHGAGYRAPRLFQQPLEKLLEYPAISHIDPAAARMVRNPGRAHIFSIRDIDSSSAGDPLRRYGGRFGVAQSLAYCTRVGDVGDGFALWRGSPRAPFRSGQARLAEALAPHLFLALRLNAARSLAPSTNEGTPCATVVAHRNGLITACDPHAVDLIAREWAGWEPPMLPALLLHGMAGSGERTHVGRTLHARGAEVGNLIIVRLRRHAVSALLTPAQARVAERLRRAGSYKEIARDLVLSPATVRNHAHAIYTKLEIGSRAALAEKLARGDIAM